MRKKLFAGIMAVCLMCLSVGGIALAEEQIKLSDKQTRSILMLNYLAVLTQELNSSKDKSRLYLEDIYFSIYDNTHPNAVDITTQEHLDSLLNLLDEYRAAAVKREHLEFIYEQNQAQTLKSVIPNPVGVLSTVLSAQGGDQENGGINFGAMVLPVAYMTLDSALNYLSAKSDTRLQYLKSGWELDADEQEILNASRRKSFEYMLNIVRNNNLPGDLALSEASVKEYVDWKKQKNTAQKIQFFESHKNTYQYYGDYWLTLASAYYDNNDFQKCIDAIKTYEGMNVRLFRLDHTYAKTLPLAIASANVVQNGSEYIYHVDAWLDSILENTTEKEWALRYFAALTYLDLFKRTDNTRYLEKAYDIALNNVNYLVNKQRELNKEYLSEFQEQKPRADATKEEKKELEKYNKLQIEERKTALPPVYEPFLLNCSLLFELLKNDRLDFSSKELESINQILHANNERVFLIDELDSTYWIFIDGQKYTFGSVFAHPSFDVIYDGTKLSIPAFLVSDDAEITARINNGYKVISDWKIQEVSRNKTSDISSFVASYTSEEAKKYKYKKNDRVHFEIIPNKDMSTKKYKLNFYVVASFNSIIPAPPFDLLDNATFQLVQ